MEWNHNQKKSEKMFLRKDAVRRKIVVDKKCLEQVKNFEYLGCEISYENEEMHSTKLPKFALILGILNNTMKPTSAHKCSRIHSFIWKRNLDP